MIVAEPFTIPKRDHGLLAVPSWIQRRAVRLGALISAPIFCLGLSLLGLVPLLLE